MAYQPERQELNEGFKALISGLFREKEKSDRLIKAFEEVVNDRATVSSLTIAEIKDKAAKELRDEIATKDFVEAGLAKTKNELVTKADLVEALKPYATKEFVRAEIAEAKQELKQDIAEVKQENLKLRYLLYAVIGLIVVFDTPVASLFSKLFNLL